MIWFYVRKGDHRRCEMRQQEEGRLELVITEPDGAERIEHFDNSAALNVRARQLEKEWRENGWEGPFSRGI